MKPGYKQTEVGVIPEDWEVSELGDLISYTKGYPFKSSEYQSTGVRVIRVSDTTYDSIKADAPIYVSESSASRYAAWQLKNHDLVISTVGSKPPMYDSMVGKVILIEHTHENTLLNQNAVLIQDRERRAYIQKLLLHQLRTKRYLLHIEAIYRGNANQASITLKELFQFRIPLPSHDPEQRAIAGALSDVDALLGAQEALLAKKRDLKAAAMQQLLTGEKRLPGFTGEWEVVTMRQVLTQNATYGIVTAGNFVQNGVKMLRGGDIADGRINTDLPMVTLEKATEYHRTSLVENDVVIALVGYPGASAKVSKELSGSNISRAVGLLRMNSKVSADFLVCFLNSPDGRRMVLAPSAGSAQQVVNLAALNKLQFSLPPLPEQTAIAAVLSDMDAEIAALEAQRDKTRALKQGMMQELLTGRIRLI